MRLIGKSQIGKGNLLEWGGGFGSASYDADAQALFDAFTTDPGATRKGLINDVFLALKAASIFTKLDILYVHAAHEQSAALLNWLDPTGGWNGTAENSPTFTTDVGFTGNASNMRINTNYNVSNEVGRQWAQNSAVLFAWSNTSAQRGNAICGTASGNIISIYPRFTDDKTYWIINDNSGGGFPNVANTAGNGLFVASRLASNASEVYRNGASLATNTAGTSAAPSNANLTVLFGDSSYSSHQCLCFGAGSGLTDAEVSDLYDALLPYMQAVAGI